MTLPGMVHARVVRPAWRSARLLELDVARVKALPGVVAVITEGRFLAVATEREEQAMRAVRRIQSIGRWSDANEQARTLHPRDFPSLATHDEVNADRQDAASAARAVRTLDADYTRPFIAHASIGPSCAVAHRDGEMITVWCHSQSIGPLRREIARVLDWPEERLRLAHVQGSGCYGHNGADDVALDAALVARALPGRPVRLQWTREDEFTCEPFGSAMLVRLHAGLDDRGRIVAWRHDLWSHGHTARPGAPDGVSLMAGIEVERGLPVAAPRDPPLPSGGAHRNAIPIYDFPNLRVEKHHVPDPVLRVSSLRSLGAHGNVFGIESFMDELAHATLADPVEFRLRHLVDLRAKAVIEAAAAMAGWPSRPAGEGRGYGLGFARYKNTGAYVAVIADVEAGEEIRLRRAWAAVDVGLVVNPDGVAAQIEGGIVQAASWSLKESVAFDGETVLTRNWSDYPILGFGETPEVTVRVLDGGSHPWVGAGEGAQGPTAAAIANAVFAALGARVRDLPITRDRVVAALFQGTS
jgi:CO/xanthine dehydrogenase Mo-binding subunit